jgi:hypothetical protein
MNEWDEYEDEDLLEDRKEKSNIKSQINSEEVDNWSLQKDFPIKTSILNVDFEPLDEIKDYIDDHQFEPVLDITDNNFNQDNRIERSPKLKNEQFKQEGGSICKKSSINKFDIKNKIWITNSNWGGRGYNIYLGMNLMREMLINYKDS